jgi:hypothetical protein
MKYLICFLALSVMSASLAASASPSNASDLITEGLYVNETDLRGACSIEVKRESRFWNTYSLTVFRKSLNPSFPDQMKKSDAFSIGQMLDQATENSGKFLIFTKKTATKTRKISGSIFEKDGVLFWKVGVSSEACVGFCSSSAADCTVQISN